MFRMQNLFCTLTIDSTNLWCIREPFFLYAGECCKEPNKGPQPPKEQPPPETLRLQDRIEDKTLESG